MQRPAQLILIRHGESERNAAKREYIFFRNEEWRARVRGIGYNRVILTDRGILQAAQTGAALFQPFGAPDYLYHSGYARAEQTAEGILQAFTQAERGKIQVRFNPFIRERDSGYCYDMTEEEANRMFPYLREHFDTQERFFARPPGGESILDVCTRVYMFLNILFRDRIRQKVWIVTHGGTIRAFRFWLEHWSYEQIIENWENIKSPNCGVTVYAYDQVKRKLVLKQANQIYYAV